MNETHISLNENVFSLIKRVKHLAEFTDYPLLEVLAIYFILILNTASSADSASD